MSRVRGLFPSRRRDAELTDEIQAHLDLLTGEFVGRGMTPAEARLAARREFGGVEHMKDVYRDQRGFRVFDELAQDVRYAARTLRKSLGFTIVAVLSLALGIGANTAIFNLLETVLFRSLPVHRPEELVVIGSIGPTRQPNYAFSYRLYERIRASGVLADAVASTPNRMNVEIDGRSAWAAPGQLVSGNYYRMLGVPAAIGRTILPEDDAQAGGGPVAVLSYSCWQQRFGSDPSIIGKVIRLNGYPFTIVGVSAPEFFGTRVGQPADITVPLHMQVEVMPDVGVSWISGADAQETWLELMGRLRLGMPPSSALAALQPVFKSEYGNSPDKGDKINPMRAQQLMFEPGSRGLSALQRRFSRPLAVMMGIVALVLLVACANVASLLLARAAARTREIAVRVALGASRGRLIRQFLTESLLLSTIGGACGVVLAWWTSDALAGLLVPGQPHALAADLDVRVLAFALAVSMASGLLFGVAPAFGAAQIVPNASLKENAARPGGGRVALDAIFIVAQLAVSAVLVTGAGLFVRTLANLHQLDLGFDAEHVLALRIEPNGSNQKALNLARLMHLHGDLLARVEAVPGVRSASFAGATPLSSENPFGPVILVAGHVPHDGENMRADMIQIYPRYFSTLGIPLRDGRDFGPADNVPPLPSNNREPIKVIVNETLARRFFPGSSPIGRQIGTPSIQEAYEVIGVVGDARERGLREAVAPRMYVTYATARTGRGQVTLVVLTAGDPKTIGGAIWSIVRGLDATMPLREIESIRDRATASVRQERLVALLSSLFSVLALVVAAVGLYGVMSYAVARRTIEIGIRMALGAGRQAVVWMVLRRTFWLVGVGVAIGLPLALLASRFVESLLFGLKPTDGVTMAAALAAMTVVGALAGYIPARRAARVDPMIALRAE